VDEEQPLLRQHIADMRDRQGRAYVGGSPKYKTIIFYKWYRVG